MQNDADIDVKNHEGLRAIDLSKNNQINQLIQKKADVKKMVIPNLTKGSVYRVTSTTYRLKERVLIINPFKNEWQLQRV